MSKRRTIFLRDYILYPSNEALDGKANNKKTKRTFQYALAENEILMKLP